MTEKPALVEFDSVGKRYGDATVLDGVDLTVRAGEFHCLAGPNGAGKSTLFRLAAELTRPTRGRVIRRVDGVGCGFQTPNFYPDLTVAENLDVFAGLAGGPDEAWVETVSAALRLDRVRHRRGDALSGGFATALDLGLALLSKPRLVLLDEPLSDLDGATRDRVVDVLETYRTGDLAGESDADAPDRTVVVATHNVGAFESVATRVTLLAEGDVVLDAGADEVRAELAESASAAVATGDATGEGIASTEAGSSDITGGAGSGDAADALQSRYERLVADHWERGDEE
ncbi:ATP-binding cassette domain-containing protein [Halorussus sp. AFM4]|uniref:ATP-binding cassette domain-containing protein n=1 Tax=Halorussus sp. AFM4 TaxID=3421651 RepID=UPI003EBFD827